MRRYYVFNVFRYSCSDQVNYYLSARGILRKRKPAVALHAPLLRWVPQISQSRQRSLTVLSQWGARVDGARGTTTRRRKVERNQSFPASMKLHSLRPLRVASLIVEIGTLGSEWLPRKISCYMYVVGLPKSVRTCEHAHSQLAWQFRADGVFSHLKGHRVSLYSMYGIYGTLRSDHRSIFGG